MSSVNNRTTYQQGGNTITSTQVVFGGDRYNLADITGTSRIAPTLKREYGYALIGVGVILLIAGYLVWGVFLTPMLVGTVLIVVGIAVALLVRRQFTVHLLQGERQLAALPFSTRAQAEQFLAAIKQAQAGATRTA
jgi:hypothetical protein